MEVENMAHELLDAITEYFDKDDDMFIDILKYLYKTSTDTTLQYLIIEWFEANNFCLECGSPIYYKTIEEHHTELCGNPSEYFQIPYCPNCGELE